MTFLDNDTLLIGGLANTAGGVIRQIDVTRGAGNHITGFAGASTPFATAPFIDGGLSFGPSGVLFFTGFPVNTLGEIKSGSGTPDKTILLDPLGIGHSVGTLAFVPPGFAGAGQFKIASFNGSTWYTVTLTPDGSGTFNVSSAVLNTTILGGPEGIVYVHGVNPGFAGVESILVSEFSGGAVGAYAINGSGDPIPASRKSFITGLTGAEGAIIDPLTGDFLFSTFGGGDRVVVISGFVAPTTPGVPEPATFLLLAMGVAGLAVVRHRKP